MKNKYTRRQIQEAIGYWKDKLAEQENKKVGDACCEETEIDEVWGIGKNYIDELAELMNKQLKAGKEDDTKLIVKKGNAFYPITKTDFKLDINKNSKFNNNKGNFTFTADFTKPISDPKSQCIYSLNQFLIDFKATVSSGGISDVDEEKFPELFNKKTGIKLEKEDKDGKKDEILVDIKLLNNGSYLCFYFKSNSKSNNSSSGTSASTGTGTGIGTGRWKLLGRQKG